MTCPFTQFVISCQFFNEAAAAWIRRRILKCKDDISALLEPSQVLRSYLIALETEWKSGFQNFRDLKSYAKLQPYA